MSANHRSSDERQNHGFAQSGMTRHQRARLQYARRLPGFFLGAAALCAGLLSLGGACAKAQDEADQSHVLLTFSAMGDVPYSPEESERLVEQVAKIPAEADFVVHVGDIKKGDVPCLEPMYEQVATTLKQCRVPVFIIPGDNEWNDCFRPEVAWQHWRRHLLKLDQHWMHGFDVARQEERDENFAFVHKQVLLIGVNLVGGRVLDKQAWQQRMVDDADWIDSQVEAHQPDVEAMVVFTHAGPGENQTVFFDRFEVAARRFGNPILLIHGDGHRWVYDRPFRARNVWRVQVDQGGIAPPVLVRVTERAEPFQFDRGERGKPDDEQANPSN